jgi:hypothetical protein
MNVKELKATLISIATFLIRPSIFLILGLVFGYALGYTDAFRQRDTVGDKVSRAIYRMHPEALSAGVNERAHAIRQKVVTPAVFDTVIPP